MKPLNSYGEFNVYHCTAELAKKYVTDICQSLDKIPLVDKYQASLVLASSRPDRIFHAKWQHSLMLFILCSLMERLS